MAQISFFRVLKSNVKCAFCKKQNCPVRFLPERKRYDYYEGSRYVTKCEKDKKAREDSILKRKLP